MAYTTSTIFQLAYPHRTVATFPGTTQFAQMVIDVTANINDFLDETADIASSGDSTHEANVCIVVANVLLEAKLQFLENLEKTPLSERLDTVEPDLNDLVFANQRAKLQNLRRKNKPAAMNFNMNTGRIRR